MKNTREIGSLGRDRKGAVRPRRSRPIRRSKTSGREPQRRQDPPEMGKGVDIRFLDDMFG
jgi:hypothetical protein